MHIFEVFYLYDMGAQENEEAAELEGNCKVRLHLTLLVTN